MILITGATGLVGSHLAMYLLKSEDKIRAIYRNVKSIEKTKKVFELYKKQDLFSRIEWISADINDVLALEIAFEGVEYVYHCAALISFDPKDENQLRKINIEGTANIVNFCLAKNIKKLCHVSSIAALGDLQDHKDTIDEETDWNPEKAHSFYSISKYGSEIEVFRGQQEGLKVVIVNAGVVLGPGFFESGSGEIFTRIKNGMPFYTNGSTAVVAVVDLVKIMHLLMKSNINGERFAVFAANITYKKLVETIAKSLKVKPPKRKIPKIILNLAWRIDWFLANILFQKRKISRDLAYSLTSKDLYANDKIITLLNYNFKNFEQTIDEVVETSKI